MNGSALIGRRRDEARCRKCEPEEIAGPHGYAYAAVRRNSTGKEFVDAGTVADTSFKAALMAEVHEMPGCPVVRVRMVVVAEI